MFHEGAVMHVFAVDWAQLELRARMWFDYVTKVRGNQPQSDVVVLGVIVTVAVLATWGVVAAVRKWRASSRGRS